MQIGSLDHEQGGVEARMPTLRKFSLTTLI